MSIVLTILQLEQGSMNFTDFIDYLYMINKDIIVDYVIMDTKSQCFIEFKDDLSARTFNIENVDLLKGQQLLIQNAPHHKHVYNGRVRNLMRDTNASHILLITFEETIRRLVASDVLNFIQDQRVQKIIIFSRNNSQQALVQFSCTSDAVDVARKIHGLMTSFSYNPVKVEYSDLQNLLIGKNTPMKIDLLKTQGYQNSKLNVESAAVVGPSFMITPSEVLHNVNDSHNMTMASQNVPTVPSSSTSYNWHSATVPSKSPTSLSPSHHQSNNSNFQMAANCKPVPPPFENINQIIVNPNYGISKSESIDINYNLDNSRSECNRSINSNMNVSYNATTVQGNNNLPFISSFKSKMFLPTIPPPPPPPTHHITEQLINQPAIVSSAFANMQVQTEPSSPFSEHKHRSYNMDRTPPNYYQHDNVQYFYPSMSNPDLSLSNSMFVNANSTAISESTYAPSYLTSNRDMFDFHNQMVDNNQQTRVSSTSVYSGQTFKEFSYTDDNIMTNTPIDCENIFNRWMM